VVVSNAPEPVRTLPTLSAADLHLERLSDVTVVVYGAVLSYALFLVAQQGGLLLAALHANTYQLPLAKVLMLSLVCDYMIADFVEAQVFTHAVPYQDKTRFALDLLISMSFLGACEFAGQGSRIVLPALGSAVLLGAMWGVRLRIDGRNRYEWTYPACVVGTHVAGAMLAFAGYKLGRKTFGLPFAYNVWTCYLAWLFLVAGAKEFWGVPEPADFNIAPVSIVAWVAHKSTRLVFGWWKNLGQKK